MTDNQKETITVDPINLPDNSVALVIKPSSAGGIYVQFHNNANEDSAYIMNIAMTLAYIMREYPEDIMQYFNEMIQKEPEGVFLPVDDDGNVIEGIAEEKSDDTPDWAKKTEGTA